MTTKFYVCPVCGNVIVKLVDSGVTPSCCGQTMKELVPNTTDGKVEAHVPVFERTSPGTIMVSIGSTPHPMTREHHISFIYIETKHGGQFKWLSPECTPEVVFDTPNTPCRVYSYCNIHGLWMLDLPASSSSKS